MGQECSTCARSGDGGPNNFLEEESPERVLTKVERKTMLNKKRKSVLEHDLVAADSSTQGRLGLRSATYFDQDIDELEELSESSLSSDEEHATEPRPIFTLRDGGSYHGEWRGNDRHGFGIQYWADGASYKGEWDCSTAHGKGTMTHVDGDTYSGEWRHNVAHGLGVYTHRDASTGRCVTYHGQWAKDLQCGFGVEKWEDRSVYQGQFKAGHKDGVGCYTWPDGSEYTGSFAENSISGPGAFKGPKVGGNTSDEEDHKSFAGQWRRSKIHGIGEYSWPDGRRYWGIYQDGKKHGFGVFMYADERRYEGFWVVGKQHGEGQFYYAGSDVPRYGTFHEGRASFFWDSETEDSEEEESIYSKYSTYRSRE